MLVSVCAGCGGESTATEQAEVAQTTATEESTPEQTTEPTEIPEEAEEPHTHNYTEETTTDATCEADGLKTFTCECGDTYTEAIPATSHIFENYISNNDATYLADGTETAKCNICELTDTRIAEGSKLEYTYTKMNTTMYATQTVNVRNLPNTDGEKVGSLSTNQEITVLGQCNETGWYQLPFTATLQIATEGITHHLLWNHPTSFDPDTNLICHFGDGTQVTISDFATYRSCPMAYVTLPDGTSGWALFYDGAGCYFTW